MRTTTVLSPGMGWPMKLSRSRSTLGSDAAGRIQPAVTTAPGLQLERTVTRTDDRVRQEAVLAHALETGEDRTGPLRWQLAVVR